jgi:Pyruvate phosphate dikinase, AMP/ATP-binding domain
MPANLCVPTVRANIGVGRPLSDFDAEVSAMAVSSSAPAVHAVRRFVDLRKQDVDFAGGKGANLGELTRAGLPVPPGFVIGAPAYSAFCEAAGLRTRSASELEGLDVDDTAALGEVSARVREMIRAEPLPSWLEGEIRVAYEELTGGEDSGAVAVRSSATAEDTKSASFAGMNETFLGVRGADALVDAVRRCSVHARCSTAPSMASPRRRWTSRWWFNVRSPPLAPG